MAIEDGSCETVGSAHSYANEGRRLPKLSRSILKVLANGKWLPSPRSRKWPCGSSIVQSGGGVAQIK